VIVEAPASMGLSMEVVEKFENLKVRTGGEQNLY
jgi:hypothetical protein